MEDKEDFDKFYDKYNDTTNSAEETKQEQMQEKKNKLTRKGKIDKRSVLLWGLSRY